MTTTTTTLEASIWDILARLAEATWNIAWDMAVAVADALGTTPTVIFGGLILLWIIGVLAR